VDTFSLFPFQGNEMSIVNDYAGPDRSEFHKSQQTPPNCKYQVIKSNGWPYVFVMATCKIKKGQPLRADYGDAFWETVKEERFEKRGRLDSIIIFKLFLRCCLQEKRKSKRKRRL
jgi:hypothetical protein